MAEEKHAYASAVPVKESSPDGVSGGRSRAVRERPRWLNIFVLIVDILLALSPLLFLGIAIAAIAYNHKRIPDSPVIEINWKSKIKWISGIHYSATGGQLVIDVANVAVSIFPILFAAVVGRFLKAYALHRAEHGSKMGVLEQLYGSQSLSNAVQLSFALRGPGILGLAVVLVWCLSPLGGQGVKRVLGKSSHTDVNNSTIY